MKNKKIKLTIISVFLLLVLAFFSFNIIKADSGWDSDYDSGSSWDSGGSWSSDYDYGSSGSSIDGPVDVFIIFIIVAGVIIFTIIDMKRNPNGSSVQSNNYNSIKNSISETDIKVYLPNFNKANFLNYVYDTFIKIQEAWMNFDNDTLRKYLTDELYNTYKSQLKTLKLKKQKNIMEDFTGIEIDTTDVSQNEGKTTITVELIISFYDYVVDSNNAVVRGTKASKLTNHYELTFICSESKKNKNNKCPNCNAPLDNSASHTCPYCGSTIVSEQYNWILSKKEIKR